MDNVYIQVDSSEQESSENSSSSDEELNEDIERNSEFMNNTNIKDYEKNRNLLFTQDLQKRILVVDSHNVHQTSTFNSSNYKITFNTDNNQDTNITIHNNVIGFRLLKANIRSPPFNINTTNNVIYYTIGGAEVFVTINPGSYTLSDLASVFGVTTSTNSQYVTYSSPMNNFTVAYYDNDDTSSGITNDGRGLRFKFTNSSDFTINWNKNNITRGAAKLFGFFPEDSTSSSLDLYSNKIPDISSHYADLVIPEIPQIACKHNSYGADIIERIPLSSFHGEYVYHKEDYNPVNYFFPIKLHQLTIQLYSENKELYDCNNSDNNFEFEITLVKNLNLLK